MPSGNKSKTNWPSKKEIRQVLKGLEKKEGFLHPPENPTPLERFRFDLQQKFVSYIRKSGISQKELASLIGVDETKVGKILRNHLDEFSTDRLITLYEKINPKVKLKVS